MQVCVLGSIRIRTTTGTVALPHGGKQRLLLATLVVHSPRVIPADRLIDVLWGDALPDDPAAALRTQVSRLRATLVAAGAGDRLRRGEFSGYGLELAADELDAAVFEALVQQARTTSPPADVLAGTEAALALWEGEPYGEFRDVAFFLGEVSRLRELWLTAGELRTQALLDLGRHTEALTAAAALIDADPLRERSRALSMQVLHRSGRQHEALATFQEYRRLLSEELGLTPSPALREMEAEIARRPVSPLPVALLPVSGRGGGSADHDGAAAVPDADLRQEIRFTRSSDGVRLAYATVGDGPPLVKAANWLNHLEFDWESPVWRRLFREIAARRTLVRYDERACGLSDPDPAVMSLDAWVLDLECIVDACGLERFPLLGISQGCAVCIEYAARHPERVSALVLHGGYAAGWRVDPSFGETDIALRDASIEIVRHGWGEDTPAYRQMFTQTFIPGGTAEEVEWFNELQRRTVKPQNAARFMETFATIDVRHRLAELAAPTLVLHSRGDRRIRFDMGLELATAIPGARFVPLDSENHLILEHEPAFDVWMDEVTRFLAA